MKQKIFVKTRKTNNASRTDYETHSNVANIVLYSNYSRFSFVGKYTHTDLAHFLNIPNLRKCSF